MTDTITLPRAVLEQALEALTSYCNTGEIDGADDLLASLLFERDQLQVEQKSNWQLVGWWHQTDDPDECDFFFADAINGDCPQCFPCYAAIGAEK